MSGKPSLPTIPMSLTKGKTSLTCVVTTTFRFSHVPTHATMNSVSASANTIARIRTTAITAQASLTSRTSKLSVSKFTEIFGIPTGISSSTFLTPSCITIATITSATLCRI